MGGFVSGAVAAWDGTVRPSSFVHELKHNGKQIAVKATMDSPRLFIPFPEELESMELTTPDSLDGAVD
jgi:hypothetical protein